MQFRGRLLLFKTGLLVILLNLSDEKYLLMCRECITIYTDRSKLENNVGLGIFSEQLINELVHRLPDPCSILQEEIVAIWISARCVQYHAITSKAIRITTDRKEAIRSLSNIFITSKFVLECQISLEDIARHFDSTQMWISEQNRTLYSRRTCACQGPSEYIAGD